MRGLDKEPPLLLGLYEFNSLLSVPTYVYSQLLPGKLVRQIRVINRERLSGGNPLSKNYAPHVRSYYGGAPVYTRVAQC